MKEFHVDKDTRKWHLQQNKEQKKDWMLGWKHVGEKENLLVDGNSTFYVCSVNPNKELENEILLEISDHIEELYKIKIIRELGKEISEEDKEMHDYQDYISEVYDR